MSIKINEDNSCYRCFICWDDIDFEDTSTKIVSACNCISTDFKYTHKECLNLWINQNRRAGLKCQVCGTPFHVKKVLKPLKKIYMENWKSINCLFLGMTLVNILIWLLCIQWGKELERINSGSYSESSGIETIHTLTKYDEWYSSFDERENYIEDFINEINFVKLYQNIYINSTTLILFVNAAILILFFYHEKEKYVEYSIDEDYEYKKHSKSPSKYLNFTKDQINDERLPNNDDHLSNNRNNIYNDYEYQKIRII
ncbi:hypothetical protein PIROE2DRAFT_60627 [Piromyces sp. E2]|nr:hypothetical protein PIROE2DRAFT_60627 [Piromyces sp. E2]|eukprot:OUM64484.1 hypothetical protein PIROE2DRAFT_60627 [Piromyces sp. E2]